MAGAWRAPPSVIPGRASARTGNLELIISGFRVRCSASPRNDSASSRRPHPIAMKTIGNAMAKMHQRDRAGLDISGIEYRKIAAVFPRAPDRGEQPAVAFRGVGAAFDKAG